MQWVATEQAHNETHWHENAKEGDDQKHTAHQPGSESYY